ncbi:SemiSWEET transporter [Synechococcus elongatus IITB7]|uniref:SemiSWEET transporter n=1 Tax=Synechococcus elongatus TaxID=32046 RepID=UPI0030CBC65B
MNELTHSIGAIAAFCTTISFLPQVLKILKTGDTRAISLPMYALFVAGVGCWLTYGWLRSDWPIIAANLTTGVLSGTVLLLKLRSLRTKPR